MLCNIFGDFNGNLFGGGIFLPYLCSEPKDNLFYLKINFTCRNL